MERLFRKDKGAVINHEYRNVGASLTIEASFVLPIFLYFMLIFLSMIQILIVQEQIQAAITKMGYSLSKAAYILEDFPDVEDVLSLDFSVFDENLEVNLKEFINQAASNIALKGYSKKYIVNHVDTAYIKGGFSGISFYGSRLFEDHTIDIVVSYKVRFPIKIFMINELPILQRVRLRSWTGYSVAAAYKEMEEQSEDMVYVSETGKVYHKTDQCSHIKLSVRSVSGIPYEIRNNQGEKYKPCEVCNKHGEGEDLTYFITEDGNRYHIKRDCSKIKRSVRKISRKDIDNRTPCKRCYD